jgi:predicted DNA-binding transcriptional regulator AlpA
VSEQARIIAFPAHRRHPERLLTLSEVREARGGSERWWRYRIAEGLPTVRWGGTLRFRISEIEAWMEARYSDAS